MTLHLWISFAIATFFICLTPGPNMLQVMSSSIQHGLRRSFFTMLGCFIAVIIMITSSVAGVGVLLNLVPSLFDVLRIAGALYLIYLGVQEWRSPVASMDGGIITPTYSPATLFHKGFLVGISNPKALLFAAAFFPQFIDPNADELPQMLILLATFSVLEFGCYLLYALGGKSLAVFMKRDEIRRRFQRAIGGLFALFGFLLLARA